MKSIASVLSIIALGFGLLGCPGSGGGGGGSTSAFAVSTTAADFGVVGNAYTSTLSATGGTAPFTWTLFTGALPAGLSLNASTGAVTGTPVAPAGNFTATFTVTDSIGQTATGSVLFAIHPRTDRVSVDSNGTAGNGASSAPSISGDGSLVAFASLSANFVATVSGTQIYVHNRQTNQIELVSRDNNASVVTEGNGVSNVPTMSADGRYVAFVSLATDLLAPGPAVPAGQQIYVRDRQTGLTSLVSVDNDTVSPNPGTGVSSAPSISADGRYVAFVSLATDLLAPGPVVLAGQQIYIRDRQLGQSSLASQDNTNTNVEGVGGVSNTPSTNSDGGFVAFFSQATNLVAGSGSHIYVRALP
jgi:Tol biopolymer transport system component